MTKDNTFKEITKDSLIMKFEEDLFEKHGGCQISYIRQIMRQLEWLMFPPNEKRNDDENLIDYLQPKLIDLIIDVT